ncbi:restriction endonuclease subunit S [Yersinia sp. HM-2024]|uniref:restriction endonuclease subunit S n=1 Tax=Yersinia sp. HM-2024 TaxID=3344550 RepID=UPI00370DD2BE
MESEVQMVPIGELCDFLSGFAFKSEDLKGNSGIPVVKIKNVNNKVVTLEDMQFYPEDKLDSKVSRFLLSDGDVLIAMTGQGSVGRVGRLTKPKGTKLLLNQRVGKFIPKKTVACLDYIYYVISSEKYENILFNAASGSGQPNLSPAIIKAIQIPFVPLKDQIVVSQILTKLDNKITLNRQINQTLEQMAQTLFKSWFVDFDPVVDNALDAGFFEQDLEFPDELLRRAEARKAVRESADFKALPEDIRQLFPAAFEGCSEPSLGLGGWVPEGWKVKILGEITSELRRGISPKYIDEGGVQVINQKCIRNHEVSYEPARRHDQEAKRTDGRALKLGDVLVNSTGVGTLGRIAQVTHLSETTVADSHVTVVRVIDNACPIFTFGQLMLSLEALIERLGEGSTGQTELSRKILSEQFVVLPPFDIAEKAERSFKSFSEKQVSNRQQNSELIKLRDTLLPKLISGDLRISDSEVDTAEEVLA